MCQSGIVNIEVVDGDDCLGADIDHPSQDLVEIVALRSQRILCVRRGPQSR